MKSFSTRLSFALGLATSAGIVLAQAQMDANQDGAYSFDELSEAFPDMTEETFMTIDGDGDGMISAEELEIAQEGGMLPSTNGG